MLSKKMAFKNIDEAQQAATKIVKEANQIRSFFRKIAAEGVNVDWPYEVISMLAEVSSYCYKLLTSYLILGIPHKNNSCISMYHNQTIKYKCSYATQGSLL